MLKSTEENWNSLENNYNCIEMSTYDALSNDNLIEIAQYHPPLRFQLDDESREFIESQSKSSTMMLYDWEDDMINHRAIDIIKKALIEEEDEVVYTIMDRLGFNNHSLNEFVAINAARYNRLDVIDYVFENTHTINNQLIYTAIAYGAAKGGNRDLLHTLSGAHPRRISFLYVARGAARGGHLDILMDAIRRSNFDVKDIWMLARYAAKGCNLDIVVEMLEIMNTMPDASDYSNSYILISAAEGGCEELILHLANGITLSDGTVVIFDNWEPYVTEIAYSGAEDLLDSLIDRGAFGYRTHEDFKDLASRAARGGQTAVLHKMMDKTTLNVRELTQIARSAAEGGHKEILLDMILKGAKFNYLNFGKHEDAKLYFQ